MTRPVEELCAPEGLLPAEQTAYWRALAHELYGPAKRIALRARAGVSMPADYIALEAVIAKAEGRSNG